MKVLVLGAAGFIGNLFTNDLLKYGYEVIPITRQDLNITNFNEVQQFLHKTNPYAVINCTIPSGRSKIDNLDQSDVDNHLSIFLNFYNLSEYFEKFITIGSGAEFNRSHDITNASELDILNVRPLDNYGRLKNLISRISIGHNKFYTLRVFGCFDPSESADRLFSKLFTQQSVAIDDREFDFISVHDLCTVLRYYLNNTVIYRDVNCVYSVKKQISEIVNEFVYYHKLPIQVNIRSTNNLNYSGNSSRLDLLKLPLDNLTNSIENYKK